MINNGKRTIKVHNPCNEHTRYYKNNVKHAINFLGLN